jgi:hypothetical protein
MLTTQAPPMPGISWPPWSGMGMDMSWLWMWFMVNRGMCDLSDIATCRSVCYNNTITTVLVH